MKAVVIDRYGGKEVAEGREAPRPTLVITCRHSGAFHCCHFGTTMLISP